MRTLTALPLLLPGALAHAQLHCTPHAASHTAMRALVQQPFGAANTVTIHIRLRNGKTGQPVANKEIFLERAGNRLLSHAEDHDIKTDTQGLADAVVSRDSDILNPVVVDHKSCTPRTKHQGEHEKSVRFSLAQILASGVVAQNTCGKVTQTATPGELTLYVRPMNVLERITD